MKLSDAVTNIKGVGEVATKQLEKLGVVTVWDLLTYYPRRYEDFSNVVSIKNAKPGVITIKVKIKQVTSRYSRRGLHVTEALVSDDTGSTRIIWFNQPYRGDSLKSSCEYYISGEFGLHRQRMGMINPAIEQASTFPVHTSRIIPVYSETKGLKSTQIRQFIKKALAYLPEVEETLPTWLIEKYKLVDIKTAIENTHFPTTFKLLEQSRLRLGFEEVFEINLAWKLMKLELKKVKTIQIKFDETLAKRFVSKLPFKLTDEQRQSVWQIFLDMANDKPMNRLLEGDVGTGKTVVATMAAFMVINDGYQVAFLAPTEILARQHAETIYNLLAPLGLESGLELLVGSMKKTEKEKVYENVRSGRINFLVGTHALLQESVNIEKIGLLIIDEQHRFGVKQRQVFLTRTGHVPHVLTMTATPIPRSLQLTLFGELDVSIIKHKPYTRQTIRTEVKSLSQRERVYKEIDKQIEIGRQAFVVCPLIYQSDTSGSRSVEEVYKELTSKFFKHRRVGIIHGKLKSEEKQEVMTKFLNNELDILVSTTIIEVGVNIPNATVIVIENAERFGLAQIHQLRGRVGRSDDESFCYLLAEDGSIALPRLRALESTSDGFKLAEYDLELRGPGAIYGTLQHGPLELKVAKITDIKLIDMTRKAAQDFIDKNENLIKYIKLKERIQVIQALNHLN